MTEANGDNSQNIAHGETGRRLKAARETAGLELQALADQLHLRPAIVRAIEEGDYGSVPSELFLKGYVRSYARHVGISDDEMIAVLSRELAIIHGTDDSASDERVADGRHLPLEENRRRRRVMSLVGIALVVLVLLLLPFIWPDNGSDEAPVEETTGDTQQPVELPDRQASRSDSRGASIDDIEPALGQVEVLDESAEQPSVEQEPSGSREPAVTDQPASAGQETAAIPPQAPVSESPEEASLQLTFNDDCWVEVVNGEGNRVIARLASEGDRIEYSGPAPFEILLGAVSAVDQLEFMGEPVNLSDYPSRAGRVRFQLAARDFSN
ncbi:MAG: DUF4115 domain-containing protein [Halomonadaceae bacterium]|nr:MAG: DUF4115 domain-containing protein [Halomonadaceae bacterium]